MATQQPGATLTHNNERADLHFSLRLGQLRPQLRELRIRLGGCSFLALRLFECGLQLVDGDTAGLGLVRQLIVTMSSEVADGSAKALGFVVVAVVVIVQVYAVYFRLK